MSLTGLAWIRRRQRTLTRAVLAAFCLAWLQVAAMPCANALTGSPGAAPEAPVHAMASMPGMTEGEHCLYCPSAKPAADTGHGDCTFPHDPQIEARGLALTLIVAAPVPSFTLPSLDEATSPAALPESQAPPWRTPLSVQYCRFLK